MRTNDGLQQLLVGFAVRVHRQHVSEASLDSHPRYLRCRLPDDIKTVVLLLLREKRGGNLPTGHAVSGVTSH
jgi:hypothetical protein